MSKWKFYHFMGAPVIEQEGPNCWYAAAQMVVNSFTFGPIRGTGAATKMGLPYGQVDTFAKNNHLKAMKDSEEALMFDETRKASGFRVDDFIYLLSTYGPLWTPIRTVDHSCVLIGVEGDDKQNGFVRYIDPNVGQEWIAPFQVVNEQTPWFIRNYMLHYAGSMKGIGAGGLMLIPAISIRTNVNIPRRPQEDYHWRPGLSFE